MKKITNTLGVIVYAITAIVYIVSLIINYGSVSRNLDGFHGFSAGHANIFAAMCVILAAVSVFIIVCTVKERQNALCIILGVILVALPIIFTIINMSLPGNVDTDMQGLMLRTCQGFENTSVILIITSAVGFITLICNKAAK